MDLADVWVVAGAPGAGKTTVANTLLAMLSPTPALLDKDTMYGGFVEATLTAAGRSLGERQGKWYDERIKVHEYTGMIAVAREIRSKGCPVLLSAPFTTQIHNADAWGAFAEKLGGDTVRLVWVRSDADSLRQRLDARSSERSTDVAKLAMFDVFIASMHLDREPVAEHMTIDNRLCATATIENQLRILLD